MTRARLEGREIAILRSLLMRGGSLKAVALDRWQWKPALPLWRSGLVEIWYRQSHGALDGPFHGLTITGAQTASRFFPAPRGSSGAE